jgi:hypothetical protein
MGRLRSRFTGRHILWGALAAVVIAGAAFAAGYLVADDASEVSNLKTELAQMEDGREQARSERAELVMTGGEQGEEVEALEEELTAERSINGKSEAPQDAGSGEYETDYDWGAAGTIGYLTIKPISFREQGSRWILEVEAKNEASEPKTPFCADAGAVLGDTSANTYTGESVISGSFDSCEELQPGLTGTYAAEFKLPPDAKPVIAGIYGDWEQEEEAKFWELPN